jgi:hypothetical protein
MAGFLFFMAGNTHTRRADGDAELFTNNHRHFSVCQSGFFHFICVSLQSRRSFSGKERLALPMPLNPSTTNKPTHHEYFIRRNAAGSL